MAYSEVAFRNSVTLNDDDRAPIRVVACTETALVEISALSKSDIPGDAGEALVFLKRCHKLLVYGSRGLRDNIPVPVRQNPND